MTMRLDETEMAYKEAVLPGLHNETPLCEWGKWVLVDNAFPHDKIAEVDHLLVLKREAAIHDIDELEFMELWKIVNELQDDYDCVLFNLPSMRSVANIPHVHLYKLKAEYR